MSTIMYQIRMIEIDGDWADLTWSDGLPQKLYAPWLRDNALDEKTVHPGNGQRLVDIADLPEDPVFRTAQVTDDGSLSVTFDPDGHESLYPARWLRRFAAPAPDPYAARVWHPGFHVAAFDYAEIIASRRDERDWLAALARDGIALITGSPVEPETDAATDPM